MNPKRPFILPKSTTMNNTSGSRRFQLCTIEPTTDITNDRKGGYLGTLILSRYEDTFYIHWAPMQGTQTHHFAAAQQYSSQESDESWEFNKSFKIECGHIHLMQLHPNYSLTIYGKKDEPKRTFQYEPIEFVSVTELVEQLLINGIAVPSTEKEYSLSFYKRCHRGGYPYTPPHIQLVFDNFSDTKTNEMTTDLKIFWDCLHNFFLTLIQHLDNSDSIPNDPQFPLAEAARANHARVLKQIDAYIETLSKYEQVKKDEWDSLFNSEGALIDPKNFKERLFHAGIESSILADALPFVFGVYDEKSTAAEREKLDRDSTKEFNQLVEQVESYREEQIENNRRISAAFRVILHDVSRTDRQHPAFKATDGTGLKMVTKLLKTYCVFNPPIGYLQGMNDLFVPILLAFLPKWNKDCDPVDDNDEVMNYEPYLPTIFWCFDAMLRNIDHLKLLAKVTEQCKEQASIIFHIMKEVSPLAAIWMRRNGLMDLLWCYSNFVLLFKRSFADIWSVWLPLNCSPHPSHWLAYFVAAILVQGFDKLAQISDVTITTMMDSFPRILDEMDLKKIGQTSLWLAEKVPSTSISTPENVEEIQMSGFKYFETEWTGPCQTKQKPES